MTYNLFLRATALFCSLFLVGSLLCLPLFRFNLRAFFASRLWVKVVWWWPIYVGFVLALWGGFDVSAGIISLLIIQGWRESHRYFRPLSSGAFAYFILVSLALAHTPVFFVGLGAAAVPALLTICFCSALSDVVAFFFGSFIGRHPLPVQLNAGKSWEGVLGQILGSFLGYGLVASALGIALGWPLALVVGLASATGDLINSLVKRRLSIKDWGQSLPGHGGILDRFSSLSIALAAGYWLVYSLL
jgi:CDP-diglyceride synthetase